MIERCSELTHSNKITNKVNVKSVPKVFTQRNSKVKMLNHGIKIEAQETVTVFVVIEMLFAILPDSITEASPSVTKNQKLKSQKVSNDPIELF